MNDFLAKPFTPATLLNAVARHVGQALSTEPAGPPPRDPAHASNAINTEEGLKRSQGDPALYARLLRVFRDTQGPLGEQLIHAIERGDLEAAAGLAHSIKPAASFIGATRVAELLETVETVIRRGQALEGLRGVCSSLRTELDHCLSMCDELLRNQGGRH